MGCSHSTTSPKEKVRTEAPVEADDAMKRNCSEPKVRAEPADSSSPEHKRRLVIDSKHTPAPDRLLPDPNSNSAACASDPSPRPSLPATDSYESKGRPAGASGGQGRPPKAPVPKIGSRDRGSTDPGPRGSRDRDSEIGDGFGKPPLPRAHSEARPSLARQRSSGWGPPGMDLMLDDVPNEQYKIPGLGPRDSRVNMTPRTRRRSLHIARYTSASGPKRATLRLTMDSNDPTCLKNDYSLKRADSDKSNPSGEEHTITVSSPSVRLVSPESLTREGASASSGDKLKSGGEAHSSDSEGPNGIPEKYETSMMFMKPQPGQNPYQTRGRLSVPNKSEPLPVFKSWSSIPRQVTPVYVAEPNEEHGVGFTNELMEQRDVSSAMPNAPSPPATSLSLVGRFRSGSCGSESENTMYTRNTKPLRHNRSIYMSLYEEAAAYAKLDMGLKEYIDNVIYLLLIRRKHRRVRIKQMPMAFMIADLISRYALDVQVERVCEIDDASCMCIGNDRCLYLADDTTRIHRMDPGGKMVEWAGTGEWGCDNRGLSDSSFKLIRQMFADKDGTLTIVDYGNHCIREVNPRQGDDGAVRILIGKSPSNQRMPGGVRDHYMDGNEDVARFKWPKGMCNVDKAGTMFLCADDNRLRLMKREEDGTYNLNTVLINESDVEAVLYLENPPRVFFTSLDTEMEEIHVYSINWDPKENCIPDGATPELIATIEESGSCTHRNLIWDPHSQSLLLNCDARIVKLRRRREESGAGPAGGWEHYNIDVQFLDKDGEDDDADTSSFIVYDPHQDLFYFTTNTTLYKMFFR